VSPVLDYTTHDEDAPRVGEWNHFLLGKVANDQDKTTSKENWAEMHNRVVPQQPLHFRQAQGIEVCYKQTLGKLLDKLMLWQSRPDYLYLDLCNKNLLPGCFSWATINAQMQARCALPAVSV
jgi:hypothetical protein